MTMLDNYKARVNSSIGSSLKEYVKDQVRTNLDIFLDRAYPDIYMDRIYNNKINK